MGRRTGGNGEPGARIQRRDRDETGGVLEIREDLD